VAAQRRIDRYQETQTLKQFTLFACLSLLAACGEPKPEIPSLTQQLAGELLHYDQRAENWMIQVRKGGGNCEYRFDLPEQNSHPPQIDLDHIVFCNGRPAPRENEASVSFEYDKNAQRWVVKRFSS
jgi:hypothetical protein